MPLERSAFTRATYPSYPATPVGLPSQCSNAFGARVAPAVEEEEEEDEVAEAVLELKDVTAKHATELQAIAAKLGRAEGEGQALKNEMAELRAAVAAGAAAAPAEVAKQAVAAPVQETVTPPAKKSRLQRAAENSGWERA